MKLSEYAKKNSISYLTAYRHWQQGMIKEKQLGSGTIVVEEERTEPGPNETKRAMVYARVSSAENKDNLESKCEQLRNFAGTKRYRISKEIKEIGSGLNDKRPKLEWLLMDDDWDILLVEHNDRLVRLGVNYLNILLEKQGKKIEIINEADKDHAYAGKRVKSGLFTYAFGFLINADVNGALNILRKGDNFLWPFIQKIK